MLRKPSAKPTADRKTYGEILMRLVNSLETKD